MTARADQVGLLLCDRLDPDVVAQVGDYTDLFPRAFAPAGVDLRTYDLTAGEFPDDLDAHRGWVISGSRRSVDELDEPWIRELQDLTRELVVSGRRTFGICFGHQMVAQALGGRVERAQVGWGVGVRSFRVVDPAPSMDDDTADYSMLMSHRDQVVELPDGAELVATSDYCPVAAYRMGDTVLCVQGHPEWTAELSRLLLGRRREAIGADVADAALASLEHPPDSARVIRWAAALFDQASV